MSKSSNSIKSCRQRKILRYFLVAVIFLAACFAISMVTYRVFVHGADHRDFYPRWAGVRLLLSGNRDLYSEESTRAIQMELYGAPIPADRDQQGFAYPALLAVVLLPFGLIPDVEISTAAFQGFSVLLLLCSLLLLRNTRDRSSAWLVLALVLWQYPLMMIFQGQVAAIPLAAICFSMIFFDKRQDFLSGAVLSLALVKPQLAIVPVVCLLLTSLMQRRWKLILGFTCSLVVTLIASVILAGWWFPGWLQAVFRYNVYAKVIWPVADCWKISPLLSIVLVAGVFFCLVKTWRRDSHLFVAAGVSAGLLLLPQTLLWDLTLLAFPLLISWRGKTRYAVAAIWLIGWLGLLTTGWAEWWKIQEIVMPFLCLFPVFLALRHSGDDSIRETSR